MDQAARRAGLMSDALLRFESGEASLGDSQYAALVRALGAPGPMETAPAPSRPLLDLGLVGALIFLLGGAVPAIAALAFAVEALRFTGAEQANAEVIGFERRTRMAEPATGSRYAYETIAPLLRFTVPGRGEVIITGRDSLPHESSVAVGDRLRLIFPRNAPEQAELSPEDIIARPLVCAGLATPLIGIGLVSLRHWRRRRRSI